MKLIMENWRGFLKEQSDSSDHVTVAMQELANWPRGTTENNKITWKIIAKYWDAVPTGSGKHIGNLMRRRGGNYPYGKDKKPVRKQHWSAAFINYCFGGDQAPEHWTRLFNRSQDVPGFSKAAPSNHRYYWGGALKNTLDILSQGDLDAIGLREDDWVYIPVNSDGDRQRASGKRISKKNPELGQELLGFLGSDLGLAMSSGDVALVGNLYRGSKKQHSGWIHGDIVTPKGRIGGNVSNPAPGAVATQRRPVIAYITQSKEAKDALLELYKERNPEPEPEPVATEEPPTKIRTP